MYRYLWILPLIFLLILGTTLHSRVIHVPGDSTTIQGGINGTVDGDTVLVADGTYTGDGNRDLDFLGKAIVVMSENGPEVTIIDCEGSEPNPHRGFYFHSGEDSTSVIQGFTVQNGFAVPAPGIRCSGASPTIRGNIIRRNQTWDSSGGIHCYQSSAVIKGNTVVENGVTQNSGGGIYCYDSSPSITDNLIMGNGNDWGSGGGICCINSSPVIEGNTIVDNGTGDPRYNYGAGGGIYCSGNSGGTVIGNTVSGNSSEGTGGGIAIYDASVVMDNSIEENSAYRGGGGIVCGGSAVVTANYILGNGTDSNWAMGGGVYCDDSAPEISYNIIVDNGSAYGGGIACSDFSTPSILRNTIKQNRSERRGGGIYCDNSNPEISGNTIRMNTVLSGGGGGIHCYYSSPGILNNVITANSSGSGGGIRCHFSSPTISNNLVASNDASSGAGIYCWSSSPDIVNNTVAYNLARYDGGGLYAQDSASVVLVSNTIFWANDAEDGPEIALLNLSTLTIDYSDVHGGMDSVYLEDGCVLNWGDGIIDAYPRFTNYRGYYYLLRKGSPCIDAGDPSIEDGIEWPIWYANGPRSDMGAFGGPGNVGWLP